MAGGESGRCYDGEGKGKGNIHGGEASLARSPSIPRESYLRIFGISRKRG